MSEKFPPGKADTPFTTSRFANADHLDIDDIQLDEPDVDPVPTTSAAPGAIFDAMLELDEPTDDPSGVHALFSQPHNRRMPSPPLDNAPPVLPQTPPLHHRPSKPPPSPVSRTVKGHPPPPPMPTKEDASPTNLKVTGGLMGHILVQNGLITSAQRDHILKLQTQSGHMFKFGELAVKNGFISDGDLQRALRAQATFVHNVKKEQSRMIRLPEEVARIEAVPIESDTDADTASRCRKWLISGIRRGASDLHVMSDTPLVLRHCGKMIAAKQPPLRVEEADRALKGILNAEQRRLLEEQRSIVSCFDLGKYGRARGNIFYHMGGINGAFRLIPPTVPSLVSLNLPSALAKFTTYAQGLVLITGPIGCGKTTTMAALVDIVNKERRDHIITIERPLEFIHHNHASIVTQREVGTHTTGFAKALRAALREDPDVIAVGDMNDLETARLTLSAAETGHLVFATLHTDNAVRTVNRVLDIFPPDEQSQIRSMLSESLRGVICQRLVPRSDEPGLIPVVEMLFTTPAMRNLVRENKVYQLPNAIKMSRNMGNRTFTDYAEELKTEGLISEKICNQFCKEET